MLILLLSVGVVISSPLSLSTHRPAQNEDQPPTSLAASYALDPSRLVVSAPGSATTRTAEPHQTPDVIFIIESSRRDFPVVGVGVVTGNDKSLLPSHYARHSRGFFGSASVIARRPIRARLVGDKVRTVALQVAEQLPEDSFVPPLVFAQKSSEINLEPTEVEAPGTTPTTVAMVTKPVVIASNFTNKSMKSTVTKLSKPVVITKKSELNQKSFFNLEEHTKPKVLNKDNSLATPQEGGNYPNSKQKSFTSSPSQNASRIAIVASLIGDYHLSNQTASNPELKKKIKLRFDDLLQSDDPMARVAKETSSFRKHADSEFKEFKIRAINNTYTLVHEKRYQKLMSQNTSSDAGKTEKSSSSPNQGNVQNQSETQRAEELDKHNETNVETKPKDEDAFSSSILPRSDGGHREAQNVTKTNSRQSKRISSGPVWNVSVQREPSKSENTKNEENTTDTRSSGVREKEVDSPRKGELTVGWNGQEWNNESRAANADVNTQLPEQMETTTQVVEEVSENTREKHEHGNLNTETREVDDNSFFASADSKISSKKVKKDDTRVPGGLQSRTQDGSTYRIGVITSSSEVSYKQFDPDVKNDSHLFEGHAFNTPKSSNGSSEDEGNKTKLISHRGEEDSSAESFQVNQKSNTSITKISDGGFAKPHSIATDSLEEENDGKNVTLEDAVVTSLPSQTSVVEPMRANSSSALAEVTLPSSHHRTKSEHTADSHPVSSPINADVIGPYPLEVHPKHPSERRGTSEMPPGQTDPVSEHVHGGISSGCVAAIVIGVLLSMAIVGGAAAYLVHQRLEGFRPKILSSDRSCANSDSGGYLDDQCRVAYVNSQIDLPKSTPEDLVSLDNDSFLNSLESMTIQNLWTDSIRHTKL